MSIVFQAASGAAAPVDMRDLAFRNDPQPILRALREKGRVTRDVLGICGCSATVLTRAAACAART